MIIKADTYVYNLIDQDVTITYFSDLCETHMVMLGIGVKVAAFLVEEMNV